MFEVIKDRIKLSIPVMAFVGFTFMIGAVFQWVSFLKKPVDLYSVDYANLRWHDHITADMDFVFLDRKLRRRRRCVKEFVFDSNVCGRRRRRGIYDESLIL